ncbi:MAG TPA: HipA domain-containing protein [Ignavibacteriaceae bacterium]|nr:HipA domain-containing protein [Ignavibacteriaceae bacterium]
MAKVNTRKEIFVYADWKEIKEPFHMGVLYSEIIRDDEIFSFEYSDDWLKSEFLQVLDPDLQYYAGTQYVGKNKNNFGMFLDSSPDRWGQVLMKRREAIMAREENRPERTLMGSDFLLGVFDEHRIGGFRFKLDKDGDFLNDDRKFAAPPWTSIRELQAASLKIEEEKVDDPEYLKWLNMLIAPGSSLGGARPKASVIDEKGELWIAKFPSANDTKDIGGWEMVVNKLAEDCGINVAETIIEKYSSNYHTSLIKRFDRIGKERIHFASAMTMLGYTDNRDSHAGASYLELVEFLNQHGARVNEDLEELWKRIVFSICVSNTDDHLRNHGFILTASGWVLSPAFDINPNETGTGLSLNISETDNSLNFELALDVAEYFRLNKDKAEKIIKNIQNIVSSWQSVADKFDIPKSEQQTMARAFKV